MKGASKGYFLGFPSVVHALAIIPYRCPVIQLQRCLTKALFALNGKRLPTPSAAEGLLELPVGELVIEVGVAEGSAFNNLDEEELEALSRLIEATPPPSLDFLIICCCYYNKGKRRIPLRFDYHLIRFSFRPALFEIGLYHNRGPRRMPFEALLRILVKRISEGLEAQNFPSIRIRALRTL